MVEYKTIIKVIENYVVKCPTIAEMKSKLSAMSHSEKYKELEEKGLLNGGELKYYEYNYRVLNAQTKWLNEHLQELDDIENGRVDGYSASEKHKQFVIDEIEREREYIEESERNMFNYERRLLDGTKPREPQEAHYLLSLYSREDQLYGDVRENQIGELEQRQIDHQKKTLDLTEEEVDALTDYYGNSGKEWNSYIHNGARWKYNDKSVQRRLKPKYEKSMEHLSNAINKSDGLVRNTMLFHGGQFDISKIVGDTITLKGYTSCSFQSNVADYSIKEQEGVDELMYTYKLLLPRGTKGICANDNSHGKLSRFPFENEFLLDKGFTGKIVDINYENQTVTIVAE